MVNLLHNSIQFKNRSFMIQRSYLIWYKHESYFHAHWQLFLLQIPPNIIVWYILQMALFLFCHIISYVVKINLWYKDLVKTSRPKLKILKFVHLAEIFQKITITTSKLNFFKFLAFFPSVLVATYWLTQLRKKLVELQKFYKAISLQYW